MDWKIRRFFEKVGFVKPKELEATRMPMEAPVIERKGARGLPWVDKKKQVMSIEREVRESENRKKAKKAKSVNYNF